MGIKKKTIKVRNAPVKKDLDAEGYRTDTLRLYEEMKKIKKEGGHIVFADECIFTARGFQSSAWSNMH